MRAVPSLRPLHAIAGICAACVIAVAFAAPTGAEYALRWDPAAGGPATLEAAWAALGLAAPAEKDKETFSIRYYEIAPVQPVPSGYRAILRRREEDGKATLSWKLRRVDRGGPDTFTTATPCPFGTAFATEVDVTLGAGEALRKTLSRTCERKGGVDLQVDRALVVREPSCAIAMRRWTTPDKLKVEEWPLPGGRTILEVSRKDGDTDEALAQFRGRVARLIESHGVIPDLENKTEAARCPPR